MAIFKSSDRFMKWRYAAAEIYLLVPNEKPIAIPKERLVSINIIHDYEKNIFPIFRIELILEASRYFFILDHKEDIQFKLRIQKWYTSITHTDQSIKRDFINDTFDLILNDDEYDTAKGIKEEAAKGDYTSLRAGDLNGLNDVDNRIEFFLFKSNTIRSSRKYVNQVLRDCTVLNAYNYIASNVGFKRLLMAPPDNTKVYDELLIPPLTSIQAMLWLDSYYGTYKDGALLYFDFDRNYIIPYNGKCKAWERGETKETYIAIAKQTSAFASDNCTVETSNTNGKTIYIVANNQAISIKNESITYDVLAGNDIESTKIYDGTTSSSSSSATSKDGNLEYRIVNRTENPYFNETYTNQTSARSVVIQLLLADYDVDLIKPNRSVRLIFEDSTLTKKYKGYYQVVYLQEDFVKDGADFVLTTSVILKRM